jgi:hypothetical protein
MLLKSAVPEEEVEDDADDEPTSAAEIEIDHQVAGRCGSVGVRVKVRVKVTVRVRVRVRVRVVSSSPSKQLRLGSAARLSAGSAHLMLIIGYESGSPM